MGNTVTNVTTMTETAQEERQARLRQYLLTMAIRSACFILMVWVRGPLLIVLALGAIFLPMIAVMLANHAKTRRQKPVEAPDSHALAVRYEPVGEDAWARATQAPQDARPQDAGAQDARPQDARARRRRTNVRASTVGPHGTRATGDAR